MNKKLTVSINAEVLEEWNAARRRRGLTQKKALEQMMKEWCHPSGTYQVMPLDSLVAGKKRGLFDRIWK